MIGRNTVASGYETNPLEGTAYWAEFLKQARTNIALTSLLIASRVDVGGLLSSLDRIQEFASKHVRQLGIIDC